MNNDQVLRILKKVILETTITEDDIRDLLLHRALGLGSMRDSRIYKAKIKARSVEDMDGILTLLGLAWSRPKDPTKGENTPITWYTGRSVLAEGILDSSGIEIEFS